MNYLKAWEYAISEILDLGGPLSEAVAVCYVVDCANRTLTIAAPNKTTARIVSDPAIKIRFMELD